MGWVFSLKNIYAKGLVNAGLVFSIYYTFSNSVADFYLVSQRSMEPTLSEGQIVVIKPVDSWLGGVQFEQIKVIFDQEKFCNHDV